VYKRLNSKVFPASCTSGSPFHLYKKLQAHSKKAFLCFFILPKLCASISRMSNSDYIPTIGLEIHAELKTHSKMFCGCENAPHSSDPNSRICPICMAHPGTLPTINKQAVKSVLFVGVALGGELARFTEFDRKNYFYPDIPKGYQISQYEFPLVKGGTLEGVALTRIHLEEDTARSSHDKGDYSVVDYNRAGVPLMELVTEPVIRSAEEAGRFARELQLLFRTLGVSDANMEKGEMRVEANISVSKTKEFGTKTEVKNLNSFRSVERAIAYEIERQIKILESGGDIEQETRGWDEGAEKTFSQRKKESSDDYRYFPEPDLPKLQLSLVPEFSYERLKEEMPELPEEKRVRLSNLGVKHEDVEMLVADSEVSHFFDEIIHIVGTSETKVRLVINYIASDLQGIRMTEKNFVFPQAKHFAELMEMLGRGELSSRGAKDTLVLLVEKDESPQKLAKEAGLLQESDESALSEIIQAIIQENSQVVSDYQNGNTNALQFLVGQGMKKSKGSANPALLAKLLIKTLTS
jgi:aspartyl-tRNA(Asn)/glutamyl-tRNA(Gln) amidotransferase subunit B